MRYLEPFRTCRTCNESDRLKDLSGRVTTRAEDAQGTPTQSHTSPSILVHESKEQVDAGDAPEREIRSSGQGELKWGGGPWGETLGAILDLLGPVTRVQGRKLQPPWDNHRALGIGLV